jgi:hypothetical protein
VALHWPGWARSGAGEEGALQALMDAGPRFARVMQTGGIAFTPPATLGAFQIIERLPGASGTDFGVREIAPLFDSEPVDEAEWIRLQQILRACWQALDATCKSAAGIELRKGPRGGGRDLEGITRHVMEAERSYCTRLGWKQKDNEQDDLQRALQQIRQSSLDALESAVRHGVEPFGPRGGARWAPRYFVRRVAWHVVDHLWEIEDRMIVGE